MGKSEGFLTPKAIANRMKASSMQKLRWFCEMCQKQCRDSNGFKCHKMSEGHQRMMKIFVENSAKMLDSFSRQFEASFMNLVRVRWRHKRVYANKVYNEYIQDKMNVHMNATVWQSLSGFVQHLGRSGQCKIEEGEKGWYIKYIDRDPETMMKESMVASKEKMELEDEAKSQKLLEDMYNASNRLVGERIEATEMKRDTVLDDQVIRISVAPPPPLTIQKKKSFFVDDDDEQESNSERSEDVVSSRDVRKRKREDSPPPPAKRLKTEQEKKPFSMRIERKSALDDIAIQLKKKQVFEEEKRKHMEHEAQLRLKEKLKREEETRASEIKDYWLFPNIVVKVINKTAGGGAFFGKKAVVIQVLELYVGVIKVLDSNASVTMKIDQAHLETVIPALGNQVMILNGLGRGEIGILKHIDVDNFVATVTVDDKEYKKEYEHISKLHIETQ